MLGGAVYGFIPGFLKAFTGAHEVVTTIMLNSLAAFAIVGLVNDVFKITGPDVRPDRRRRQCRAADHLRARRHTSGVLSIALVVVADRCVLIYRTTLGFEIRTVGANPSAARYAGMSPRRLIVLTMSPLRALRRPGRGDRDPRRSGYYPAMLGTAIGFDGITVALLGRAHPGRDPARGAPARGMRAGAPSMQITATIPIEIIDVIQGLILFFLAAEVVVRQLFRIRAERATPSELQSVTASLRRQAQSPDGRLLLNIPVLGLRPPAHRAT